MNTVALLGTAHSIQRGETKPNEFKAKLIKECEENDIKAIAEEINEGEETIALMLAKERHLKHLYADPGENERMNRGIPIDRDIELDLIRKYDDQFPDIRIWPTEPSRDNLPTIVYEKLFQRNEKANRMREEIWLEKIKTFDMWPLLFICGATHFEEFSKLLIHSGLNVIESSKDWSPS